MSGPIVEQTPREQTHRRWLTAKLQAAPGCLRIVIGIILPFPSMNEPIGGPVIWLGLLLPVVPVEFALLHLAHRRRRLMAGLSGRAILGLSMALER